MCELKTIGYRGGTVRFAIPGNWTEQYEPDGSATFYEDLPDSGTFRLAVCGLNSKDTESSQEVLSRLIANDGYRPFQAGLAMRSRVESSAEKGEQLETHYWEVAVPVGVDNVRLVNFSYTVLASEADQVGTCEEIELLDHSIRSAEFSRSQRVPSSADEVFQAEIGNRGIRWSTTLDGNYEVKMFGLACAVNLEAVRRDYAHDCDPGKIARFVRNMIRTVESNSRAFPRQVANHMFGHFRMLSALLLMLPTTAGIVLGSLIGEVVKMVRTKIPIRVEILLQLLIAIVILLGLTVLLGKWRFPARVLGIGTGTWRFLVYAMLGVGFLAGIFLAWPD